MVRLVQCLDLRLTNQVQNKLLIKPIATIATMHCYRLFKFKIMKIQVGQIVYLKPINNRARRNKDIKTAVIKKVGRKYATILEDERWETDFNIETMVEKSNYSPDFEVYLSLEDAENSIKLPEERRKLIDLVQKLKYSDNIKVQNFINNL